LTISRIASPTYARAGGRQENVPFMLQTGRQSDLMGSENGEQLLIFAAGA
jgi:hypothetical protein